jgi:hypothetical protein
MTVGGLTETPLLGLSINLRALVDLPIDAGGRRCPGGELVPHGCRLAAFRPCFYCSPIDATPDSLMMGLSVHGSKSQSPERHHYYNREKINC